MGGNPGSERDKSGALRREIARSVDAPALLLPAFAELFRGMPSLGSQPRRAVSMLERAGIGRGSCVLDLACGKGALAITLAKRLGCTVVGVDACGAFVEEASREATRARVEDVAAFVEADLRPFASRTQQKGVRYDAALMMGLLGLAEARALLRGLVKPRGLYAVDDVFRDERLAGTRPEFAEIPTRKESRAMLEQNGDRVIEVDVIAPSRLHALNDSLYRRLAANAKRIARRNPRLRPALAIFLDNQRHANRLLGHELRPAVWIVRRA